MENREIARYSIINACGTVLYIILIASFMFFAGEGFFGAEDSVFAPIIMLMLFVFSAALTGSLVFGKPLMWYLDNKKKEALQLIVYTLLMLFILIIVFLLIFIALS